MFRITSQLCEVFNCTNQQLEENGLIDQFNAWIENNPGHIISHSIEDGEIINWEIAKDFSNFIKNESNTKHKILYKED